MKLLQSPGDTDASPLTCDNTSERALQTLKPRNVVNRDPRGPSWRNNLCLVHHMSVTWFNEIRYYMSSVSHVCHIIKLNRVLWSCLAYQNVHHGNGKDSSLLRTPSVEALSTHYHPVAYFLLELVYRLAVYQQTVCHLEVYLPTEQAYRSNMNRDNLTFSMVRSGRRDLEYSKTRIAWLAIC